MTVESIMKSQGKDNDENNIQEVAILNGEKTIFKVELGTTLKVVKLLSANEGIEMGNILGVRPVIDDNRIPCIVTLDDSKLEEQSYQLLVPDPKPKHEDENRNDHQYKCSNCKSKEEKVFVSIGVNTECGKHCDIMRDEHKIDIQQRNRLETFGCHSLRKEEIHCKKDLGPYPHKVYAIPSPPRNEVDAYRNLQEATRKLYARQPIIESVPPEHHKYIPSFIDTTAILGKSHHYDGIYSGSKACHVKEERSSLSPIDRHRGPGHNDHEFRSFRARINARKGYSSAERSPMYEINNVKDNNQNDVITKSLHTTPPNLLHFEEREKRKRYMREFNQEKGEEPPVYVLPNDFDMSNGDGNVLQKADTASLSPSSRHNEYMKIFDRDDDSIRGTKLAKFESKKDPQSPNAQNTSIKTSEDRNESPDSSTNTEVKLHCKICSSSFSSKSLLYKHLRGHSSDEKPFKCNECGQGFTLSSNLRQHRIIHRGYKPFQCEFCGKKFMRSNVYKQHRRIHTGEEMHKCSLCPSEFLQKYALIKHMKKNHNIDTADV